MTERPQDNVLIVHWHDLGRYLGVYGHADVSSPRLDQLAADGILFTRAHATAPLCSPSRGSLFTGRYPHSNGLVGLAHHGWEYRADVRTLPQILSESGYHTALFGMQHETSYPARLGFDTYDVSNSYCEYVVDQATRWLTEAPQQPFLLTAGFFETHRPYPHDRYEPADRTSVELPDYLPDSDAVRQDLAEFYGAITVADAAVGQLLDTLAATGLDRTTWVVFVTDHGPALPRAKSTLYDAGTGIALIVRPPLDSGPVAPRLRRPVQRGRLAAHPAGAPRIGRARRCRGDVARRYLAAHRTDRTPCAPRCTRPRPITTPSIRYGPVRTKEYSYIENYAIRPLLDLPLDIADSAPGKAVEPLARGLRPERELYDLLDDPGESRNLLGPDATDKAEAIANDLALLLNDWRQKTNDVIPSEFAGTRISERYTETYQRIHGPALTSRSAIAAERGIEDEHS